MMRVITLLFKIASAAARAITGLFVFMMASKSLFGFYSATSPLPLGILGALLCGAYSVTLDRGINNTGALFTGTIFLCLLFTPSKLVMVVGSIGIIATSLYALVSSINSKYNAFRPILGELYVLLFFTLLLYIYRSSPDGFGFLSGLAGLLICIAYQAGNHFSHFKKLGKLPTNKSGELQFSPWIYASSLVIIYTAFVTFYAGILLHRFMLEHYIYVTNAIRTIAALFAIVSTASILVKKHRNQHKNQT